MLDSVDALGGNVQCASSREALMYSAASFNSAVPSTLAILAETIRNPLVTETEVQQQLETAEYEIGEIWSKPELILPELVHMAAYKDNTLGNPLLCPRERLPFINKSVIEKYRETFFKPERLVVAFAGVDHDHALKWTEKLFGDMKNPEPVQIDTSISRNSSFSIDSPSSFDSINSSTYSSPNSTPPPSPHSSKILSKIPLFKNLSTSAPSQAQVISDVSLSLADNLIQPAHYTGGFLSLPAIPPPVNLALPALSYIHLGFEAFRIASDDIYALATLQTLLGGGGSFSAGGPGKGMYSRLYRNVLNQHGWVESCVAFNHSYTDSGLFGISASCKPSMTMQMLEVMCKELKNMTLEGGYAALQEEEVARAKNQLRSSLLMNLESRMVELEDLGRQVQVHGRKVGVREMCRRIEALTVKDLRAVAKKVLGGLVENAGMGSGAPTVVVQEGMESDGESKRKEIQWGEIQDRIRRWSLGRR